MKRLIEGWLISLGWAWAWSAVPLILFCVAVLRIPPGLRVKNVMGLAADGGIVVVLPVLVPLVVSLLFNIYIECTRSAGPSHHARVGLAVATIIGLVPALVCWYFALETDPFQPGQWIPGFAMVVFAALIIEGLIFLHAALWFISQPVMLSIWRSHR